MMYEVQNRSIDEHEEFIGKMEENHKEEVLQKKLNSKVFLDLNIEIFLKMLP